MAVINSIISMQLLRAKYLWEEIVISFHHIRRIREDRTIARF